MPRCVVWNVYSCIIRRPRMKPQRKTELGPMWILRFPLPWNSVIVVGKFPVRVNHTESRDEEWIRHQADSAMGTLIWKGWVGKQNLCCEMTERNRGCQHIGGCWEWRVWRKTWAIITGAFCSATDLMDTGLFWLLEFSLFLSQSKTHLPFETQLKAFLLWGVLSICTAHCTYFPLLRLP